MRKKDVYPVNPEAQKIFPLASYSKGSMPSFISQRRALRNFTKFGLLWLAIITLSVVSLLVSASQLVVKPLKFQAPMGNTDDLFLSNVNLSAEFISVNPMARTMTMNWYPVLTSLNCSSEVPLVVDIYVPAVLLDTSSPSWSAQQEDQSAFRLNSTIICTNSISYPSFRTVTKLVASEEKLQQPKIAEQSSLQNYPFDSYFAPISIYTRNLDTGDDIAPKIADSFGVAINFEISLLSGIVNRSALGQNLAVYFRIGRSTATKMFVVIIAITSWLMGLAFLTICVATLVYRPRKIYVEMFLIPVGTIFAFTSIRANLPNAPPGFATIIDLFTILPVLVITSFCSFVLLLVILYGHIIGREKRGNA